MALLSGMGISSAQTDEKTAKTGKKGKEKVTAQKKAGKDITGEKGKKGGKVKTQDAVK